MANQWDYESGRLDQSFLSLCHDLKAPLQTMLGFNAINGDILNRELLPDLETGDQSFQHIVQQINRNMEIIEREGERLSSMIGNLLDIYCLEQEKVHYNIEPFRVQELMENASALLKAGCEAKKIQWKVYFDRDLPLALLDRSWIMRVLENLISNAVKFTEAGSIACYAVSLEDKVKLVVEDTGLGIPLQYQGRIFEKFIKAPVDGVQKGSGLGLAICRCIVERHGGEIWLESREGQGSIFSFTIPAVSATEKEILCDS